MVFHPSSDPAERPDDRKTDKFTLMEANMHLHFFHQ
jgi:hypothetical protein